MTPDDELFEEQERLVFEIKQRNPEDLGPSYRETIFEVKETRDGSRVSITSVFPSVVYGVSSIAPMDPDTAIEIAGALVDWANTRNLD